MPAPARKPTKKSARRRKSSEPVAYGDIRGVREIRSGYSSFEAVDAVNDLLRRGWVLLGAQFVTSGSGADAAREFLYVIGTTDARHAGRSRSADEDHFASLAEYTRRIERGEVE